MGSGQLWIGDDAAVVSDGLLVTTDALVAGVDWHDDWSSPADVGWKAVMVNASDIAAMGGATKWLVIALVVAAGFDVDEFYCGVAEACAVVGCNVVGGDLSTGLQTVVSVTAMGHADKPIRRDGASVGEGVWVSGPLGAAARDLRRLTTSDFRRGSPHAGDLHVESHRRPVAYLGPVPVGATALIDVSDGLVADCGHIAAASGLGFALVDVPIADGATEADALHGGDDYVLVACAPAGVEIDGWTHIGTCVVGAGVTVNAVPVEPLGWEHQL